MQLVSNYTTTAPRTLQTSISLVPRPSRPSVSHLQY